MTEESVAPELPEGGANTTDQSAGGSLYAKATSPVVVVVQTALKAPAGHWRLATCRGGPGIRGGQENEEARREYGGRPRCSY